MATALNSLIAYYQTQVDAITDTQTRLEANFALENYQGAAGAYSQSAQRGPTSYSIHNRSFQFESKADAKAAMDDAKTDLESTLSATGGTTLLDNRSWI